MRPYAPGVRLVLIVSTATFLVLAACGDAGRRSGTHGADTTEDDAPGRVEARFVGLDACTRCHEDETEAWRGSHHDLAMQPATADTVLGDFSDVAFEHRGSKARFFQRDGAFFVHTDGPDGKLADFEIAYVFGATPLQQYLVKFPDGRMQTLPFCWDSRPKGAGGQRWFHIYPDETIPHSDVLHWTGIHQNWNFMCADCHSTDLRRNFDVASNSFKTTWTDIDVACEACHGPGSEHVKWADARVAAGEVGEPRGSATEMGLVASLRGLPDAKWVIDRRTGQAKREGPLPSPNQVETCARCHARRTAIAEGHAHGRPLLDAVAPALLREGLYHADGQILDEVYVWGSFAQSKMHTEGVVCTDCHDAHTAKLRTEGNGLCYRCHLPEKFDVPEHHHHTPGKPGADCVDCHMPHKTYMVVDPRRDHSIRVPRPDLTVSIGTPNACNGCHDDESPAWAVAAIDEWYDAPKRPEHFGEIFDAARRGTADAGERLARLATDREKPGIVRASAVSLLQERGDPQLLTVVSALVTDPDPLVRFGVAHALGALPDEQRVAPASALVDDRVLAVRMEAGRALAGLPASALEGGVAAARDRALEEYVAAQMVNADRAFAHVNIGVLRAIQGRLKEAEEAYRVAIRLDRRARDAWVNLADLYRESGDDAACVRILKEALEVLPKDPGVHHALGLAYVRQKRPEDARKALRDAWALGPDSPQFGYVYGVALTSAPGRERDGVSVLESVHGRHPAHRPTLEAIISVSQQLRDLPTALRYARVRLRLDPQDPDLQALVRELEHAVRGG